jgi:hypothetical protein
MLSIDEILAVLGGDQASLAHIPARGMAISAPATCHRI